MIKLDQQYLTKIIDEDYNIFGDWVDHLDIIRDRFLSAKPYEHVIIDNFLNSEYADKLHELFPTPDSSWYEYKNPIEVKYAYDKIDLLPLELKNYFYYLSAPKFIEIMKKITLIDDLEYDEYLHGAGLHAHPRYGRLGIHLDYEKHPYTNKERRLNIILYLSKDWDSEWNGCTELWDCDATKCVSKSEIKFNRAILFKTNDISWHGLSEKILCPEGIFRQSLAFYLVSPLHSKKNENEYRKKAQFISSKLNNQDFMELYNIRKNRLITKEDMDKFAPNWTIEI